MLLFILRVYRVLVPPIVTIASLSPLPGEERWHALIPGMAYRWVKKKEGWLNPVSCIGVVLITSLLVVTWVLKCPASPLMASLSRFLPHLAGSCFKMLLDRSCSSCRDISKQGPQGSLVRELVTGDPMACSIVGQPCNCPLGVIAHRQIWQLLPRL